MKLGDILNSINTGKEPIITGENERVYVPFVVNRCFSNFPDTVFQANELNAGHVVDRKMHYDYLFHTIRKRKRFSPWLRKEESKELEAVKWLYGVSHKKGQEFLRILENRKDEMARIVQQYEDAHKA